MKMNASVGQGRRAIPQRQKACATPPGSGRLLAGLLVLLGAAVVPQLHADAYHDSVVIVLDASGSMDGRLKGVEMTKMDGAKAALRTVLSQVPTSTHIGLLVFGAGNGGSDWIYPLGPRDDVRLLAAIDQPRPSGTTPLGRYLKLGADRLLEERQKQFGYGSYRLLVVTDGEAQDQELVDAYTPEVMARGITVDVIGVAMKQDHTLARKVHSYRRADDPASLQRALAEVMAEISRSRADDAREDAFALLAPIPAEVAASALQALSASGNQPIGEQPRRETDAAPSAAPAPPVTPTPSAPMTASRSVGHGFLVLGGFLCFALGLGVLALLIWVIKRASRR